MKPSQTRLFAGLVNGTLHEVLSVPSNSLLPIIDIKYLVVCPDFDEDCKDVVDPEWCMRNNFEPCTGVCMELQRRQYAGPLS